MLLVAAGFNSSLGCSIRRAATKHPDMRLERGAIHGEEPTPFVYLCRSVERGFGSCQPAGGLALFMAQPNAPANGR